MARRAIAVYQTLFLLFLALAAGCDEPPITTPRPHASDSLSMIRVVPGRVAQVSAGGYHSCALRSDGSIACWGDNTSGQSTPLSIPGTYLQVSAGFQHTCSVRADHHMVCWGSMGGADIGGSFAQVSAGGEHTCALRTDGTIACWRRSLLFTAPAPAGRFTQLSVGGYEETSNACAIRTDGTLACWDANSSSGQGPPMPGTFTQVSVSARNTCGIRTDSTLACAGMDFTPPPAGTFLQVSAGMFQNCALRTDRTITCWGPSFHLTFAGTYTQVSVGVEHACAVATNGAVVCVGGNSEGQSTVPDQRIAQFSIGFSHLCAVRVGGTVACWGPHLLDRDFGQASPPPGEFVEVAGGINHSCGIKPGGELACWGQPVFTDYGQTRPPSGTFTQLSAGDLHNCAIRSEGTVACWGSNFYGESTPPEGLFRRVSAGSRHSCGVRMDGTILCWGNNQYGQRSAPAGTFVDVSAGIWHTCGVRADGTLACWGLNTDRPPPTGTFTQISSRASDCAVRIDQTLVCWNGESPAPPYVPSPGSFTKVVMGGIFGCGLATDQSLACWGNVAIAESPMPEGGGGSNSAPVASAGGPYSGSEGGPIVFDGSLSSDPEGDPVTFLWNFGDGATATGPRPTHTYADNGTYTVSLKVTDPAGLSNTATTTATIANVAPIVNSFAGATLLVGEIYTSDGGFSDPGADVWSATADYGEGAGAQPLTLVGKTFSLTHQYATAGRYTVVVRVLDDDGGTGNGSAPVRVLSPQEGIGVLITDVEALADATGLTRGEHTALTATLGPAVRHLNEWQTIPATNQLNAFIRKVAELTQSGRISAADGASIIAYAQRILHSIQWVSRSETQPSRGAGSGDAPTAMLLPESTRYDSFVILVT